jgi:hypothetical protein
LVLHQNFVVAREEEAIASRVTVKVSLVSFPLKANCCSPSGGCIHHVV